MWRKTLQFPVILATCVVFAGFSGPSLGAGLPTGLVSSEIERAVELIGFGATTRLLRSAEPYEQWPGIRVGLEVGGFSTKNLNSFGAANGTAPGLALVPRIHITKGILEYLELVITLLPTASPTGISTIGGLAKWSFSRESGNWLAGAAYFGYTQVKAFDDEYSGNNVEFGLTFSKDYVRMTPFFGLGVLFAEGAVKPSLVAPNTKNSALKTTLHAFVGAEINLPINLAIQIDLMNLVPMGTLMIGKKF